MYIICYDKTSQEIVIKISYNPIDRNSLIYIIHHISKKVSVKIGDNDRTIFNDLLLIRIEKIITIYKQKLLYQKLNVTMHVMYYTVCQT